MGDNSIGFEYGVDASVGGGDGGWWFFKGDQTVKVGDDSVAKGPEDISAADAFPALRGTVFESGVDASVGGGDGGWWFFKGGEAVKVDDDDILKGPGPISAADAFPALRGTVFENGVDASVGGGDGGWWFFKGDEAVKVGDDDILKGPGKISAADAFPALRGTVFEDGVDASVGGGDGGWWFFKGDEAVKVDDDDILKGPEPITASDAFPALRGL
ncbi:hypothetical protein ACFO4E_25930 [Nocardiopsis mangrovi]|uniref:Uncharacterized protein n=1 Tax=Nocardiopsis mangrovi TaxID=1179818 RepID=A0ABV9E579_9ACTN